MELKMMIRAWAKNLPRAMRGTVLFCRLTHTTSMRTETTMASMVLKLPVYDTQCGAKLVRRDVVPELFGQPFSSRWVFDVEMLARLRNRVGRDRMLTDVLEFPLWTWHGIDGSKMRVSAMLRAPLELWAIARRYN